MNAYIEHIIILICLYSLTTIGLNIMTGKAGMLSALQGTIYGTGAYATAVILKNTNISDLLIIWVILILAGIVIGIGIGLIADRTSHLQFALVTIAVVEVVLSTVIATEGLGAATGIYNIPTAPVAGIQIVSKERFLVLLLILVLITQTGVLIINKSKIGLSFRSIKHNQNLALHLGINVPKVKIIAAVLSIIPALIAGSVLAVYQKGVSPYLLNLNLSIMFLTIIAIGKLGSAWGPIVGSIIMVVISDIKNILPGLNLAIIQDSRELIIGILLLLIIMLKSPDLNKFIKKYK